MSAFGTQVIINVHEPATRRNLAGLPQIPWLASPDDSRPDSALPSTHWTWKKDAVVFHFFDKVSPTIYQPIQRSRFFSNGFAQWEPTPRLMADQVRSHAMRMEERVLDRVSRMDDLAAEGGLELITNIVMQTQSVDRFEAECMRLDEQITREREEHYQRCLAGRNARIRQEQARQRRWDRVVMVWLFFLAQQMMGRGLQLAGTGTAAVAAPAVLAAAADRKDSACCV